MERIRPTQLIAVPTFNFLNFFPLERLFGRNQTPTYVWHPPLCRYINAVTEITFMADTSSNNSNNGSPVFNLSRDCLFSILRKLPIASILCFGMTCKRFRSLTNYNCLWESLCKRDWGDGSVNAVKSSNPRQIVPWMRLYKQLFKFDCVSCRLLSDPDVDLSLPDPRAVHSLNFVSNCLVLFGGACEGARRLDDTWVASIGNDFGGELNWRELNLHDPCRRFGHSCVVSGDYLVLFGGINGGNIYYNDTWVGQVAYDENHDVTLSWRLLDVSNAPPRRGTHGACCIDNRKMVIHGGTGFDAHTLSAHTLGDAWVLEISEDFRSGSWHQVTTLLSPPARSGHTLTYTGRNQVVLFGGRGVGDVLGDLWLLDTSEDSFEWVQILCELQNVPEGFSLPRVGHSATLVLGGWLLIHGGEDSSRRQKNDCWVLNAKAVLSTISEQGVLNSHGLFPMWKMVDMAGYPPVCRSFHGACADDSGCYLYVFGGMVDGSEFNGELLLVDLFPLL